MEINCWHIFSSSVGQICFVQFFQSSSQCPTKIFDKYTSYSNLVITEAVSLRVFGDLMVYWESFLFIREELFYFGLISNYPY